MYVYLYFFSIFYFNYNICLFSNTQVTVPICFDNTIESAAAPTTPYISCGTSQAIKIVSALHVSTTTPTTCPNQFVVPLALLNGLGINPPNIAILPIDPCVLPINNNVTQNLIQR
jgi:hypothetical protein